METESTSPGGAGRTDLETESTLPPPRQGMRKTTPRRVRNKKQIAKRRFMDASSMLKSSNVTEKVKHKMMERILSP